ncbi:MAG: ribonuclease HII [Verrucomicrobiales bacterium]|nr:ribonuclease HII [Verrucomicrobiales bacterium]
MPDFSHENQFRNEEGYAVIAGIDEAGRGPLAGPVVAGAVVLPDGFEHPVLNDSKQLSGKKREEIFQELTAKSSGVFWAAGIIDAPEIDRINILRATWKAMRVAFESLPRKAKPEAALIDGKPIRDFPKTHRAIVKGDSKSLSIAAASIIAKVTRDRLMIDYAEKYPIYGFERHKGYGTAAHLEALAEHGPCRIHRFSFAPVAQLQLKL